MPLQVTAYKKIMELDDAPTDKDGRPQDETAWYAHPDVIEFTERNWAGYTNGIKGGASYGYEDSHGFKVGTSGHFNQWRRTLTHLIASRPEKWVDKPQPFGELTSFGDRDGVIGATIARKLAADFAAWQSEAEKFATDFIDGVYWLDRYNKWRRIFEMAADGGVVEFQ